MASQPSLSLNPSPIKTLGFLLHPSTSTFALLQISPWEPRPRMASNPLSSPSPPYLPSFIALHHLRRAHLRGLRPHSPLLRLQHHTCRPLFRQKKSRMPAPALPQPPLLPSVLVVSSGHEHGIASMRPGISMRLGIRIRVLLHGISMGWIRFVGFQHVQSREHMGALGVFLLMQVHCSRWKQRKIQSIHVRRYASTRRRAGGKIVPPVFSSYFSFS